MLNIAAPTMKGYYKLQAVECVVDRRGRIQAEEDGYTPKLTGRVRDLTDWFGNRILNNGRNAMGTRGDYTSDCQVGTDPTAATNLDSALMGWFAGTSSVEETQSGAQNTEPYYGWKRRRFRFGAGTVATNLSEVGVGWGTSSADNLLSRALIVDVDGNQTTVTPKADEILDVWFELRYYPPLHDVEGTVTLDGDVYDYTIRAAYVTSSVWGDLIGNIMGEYSPSTVGTNWKVYDGNIQAITSGPGGLSASGDSDPYNATYQNNSYTRTMLVTCGTTKYNLTGGFRSIYIQSHGGLYQCEFSRQSDGAGVQKDGTNEVQLAFNLTWAALNIVSTWDRVASGASLPAAGEWNLDAGGTTLRIHWTDDQTSDQQAPLVNASGVVIKVIDQVDTSKWVTYTTTGASTEDEPNEVTSYPVSLVETSPSGAPTVGNQCMIKIWNF